MTLTLCVTHLKCTCNPQVVAQCCSWQASGICNFVHGLPSTDADLCVNEFILFLVLFAISLEVLDYLGILFIAEKGVRSMPPAELQKALPFGPAHMQGHVLRVSGKCMSCACSWLRPKLGPKAFAGWRETNLIAACACSKAKLPPAEHQR